MSSYNGYPALAGVVGVATFTRIAETALEMSRKKKPCVVMLDNARRVWVDIPENMNVRECVATVTAKSDPDWLAEELRFEARCRGMSEGRQMAARA